jgi:NADH:ubiquinone oxidoreductase subunit 6 (subunit J)
MTAFPGAPMITSAIFIACLVALVFGAGLAIASSRLIRSVCGLALCCFGLAGLYYFLHSPFLALMEILIYVGAVCVTIIFAVMLAEPDEPSRAEKSGATLLWGGFAFLIAAGILCGLFWLGIGTNWRTPVEPVADGSIAAIGRALLTTYSMAFELISLALLVAILGALAVARAGRTRPEAPSPNIRTERSPGFDNGSLGSPELPSTRAGERVGSATTRDLVTP